MIAIDPGVGYYAFAIFGVRCSLIEPGITDHTEPVPATPYLGPMVIESQYIARTSRVRTDDVIALAHAAGRISANYPDARWVLPATWKGSVPKREHQKRIRAALSPDEAQLLVEFNKGELKQILDAVGLGLWHLGRI